MINFFRRIRKKLADDNKPLKYMRYALGEIVLVVIGILIALQINSWNQDRINIKDEKRIMQDLSEELAYNKFLQIKGSETMTAVNSAADRLLKLGGNPTEKFDAANVFLDIDKLTWVWVSGRPTTLFDVLSGSGDFDLISSSALRKKLADLKANQESLLIFEELQNKFVDDQLRPFLNKTIDRTTVRSKFITGVMSTTHHPSNFAPSLDMLFRNREFSNLLIDLIFFTDRINGTYSRIDKDIQQIDSLITSKYPSIKAKPYIPY